MQHQPSFCFFYPRTNTHNMSKTSITITFHNIWEWNQISPFDNTVDSEKNGARSIRLMRLFRKYNGKLFNLHKKQFEIMDRASWLEYYSHSFSSLSLIGPYIRTSISGIEYVRVKFYAAIRQLPTSINHQTAITYFYVSPINRYTSLSTFWELKSNSFRRYGKYSECSLQAKFF